MHRRNSVIFCVCTDRDSCAPIRRLQLSFPTGSRAFTVPSAPGNTVPNHAPSLRIRGLVVWQARTPHLHTHTIEKKKIIFKKNIYKRICELSFMIKIVPMCSRRRWDVLRAEVCTVLEQRGPAATAWVESWKAAFKCWTLTLDELAAKLTIIKWQKCTIKNSQKHHDSRSGWVPIRINAAFMWQIRMIVILKLKKTLMIAKIPASFFLLATPISGCGYRRKGEAMHSTFLNR